MKAAAQNSQPPNHCKRPWPRSYYPCKIPHTYHPSGSCYIEETAVQQTKCPQHMCRPHLQVEGGKQRKMHPGAIDVRGVVQPSPVNLELFQLSTVASPLPAFRGSCRWNNSCGFPTCLNPRPPSRHPASSTEAMTPDVGGSDPSSAILLLASQWQVD